MKMTDVAQYELIEQREVKELASMGWLLRHKKTGARVFLLENDDNNKVFNIAFRTTPSDSTGVAHIIEHTVLCGSDKYPAKDPFVEMAKGSLNTFLNAMTYDDKTMYPVASTNDTDFRNLMSVYMDAVFHPNIVKDKRIFEQEGWHYELESTDSELTLNGVVYNEMKGAYSDPEEVLASHCKKLLFPDTVYSRDSGGDPKHIPELTYEAYLDFYRRYYHPSNSYIYLYGDMDMAEILNWIDEEYLSRCSDAQVDSAIGVQAPFDRIKESEIPYAVGEDSEDGTYLSWTKVVGSNLDYLHVLAFQVLDYVLLSAPGAPLKQALLDKGIGLDVYGGFDDNCLQTSFNVTAKDAAKEQKEEFVKTIEETLKKLAAEGISRKSLMAAMNSLEFKIREADFGRFPKGLLYGIESFSSWLYDENDPFSHFETDKNMAELRKLSEEGYFERLITEQLLENTFGCVIAAVPDKELDAREEAVVKEKLQKCKDSFTQSELEDIVKHTRELKAYQEEPSSKEDLEKIPMLDISDIRKEVLPLHNDMRNIEGTEVLYHELFTSGIAYLETVFDADGLNVEELKYTALLKNCLGVVSTEHYEYQELIDEINIHTGGIVPGFSVIQPQDSKEPIVRFSFRVKALYAELPEAVRLLEEIMYTSDLDSDKRLLEILGETRSQIHDKLRNSGHTTAVKRAVSYFSKAGYLNDVMTGVGFCDFIDELYQNFETAKEEIKAKLKSAAAKIFNRKLLLISYTADDSGYRMAEPVLAGMLDRMPSAETVKSERKIENVRRNEGFGLAAQVQYVARAGSFTEKNLPYNGHLLVLQNILNYDYLWIRLRVKGGAYGCFAGFGRDGEGYFASYRDPNLAETNDVYEEMPAYLKAFTADKRSMDRFVIGTVGEMDIPKGPSALGSRGLTAYLMGISAEQLQKERLQVLGTTQDDIRSLAVYAEAVLEQNCLCAVGNENKLRENSEMFQTIRQL